jgi:two-component system sensor histidine kinase YesM
VPRQAVLEGSYRTATLTLLLSLLFAALATTVALSYFNRMTRRLGDLGENLRSVENGDYGRQIEVGGERELRALQTSFNSMSRTIRELISERYRTQIQLQYSELKALENQIKPHFLYNTMDVIKFKALRAGAGDVVVLIETLARFFRSTLGSGNRIISLEEEVHHIDLYLQLQNYRFENRISLVQEIPQELRSIPMLRFLLQPLVENAVIHGIQPKSSHCGTIRITARCEQDTLRLQVSDDGVGMSPETLASILVAKGRVYGVQNVHHRIQVFYGKAYGLSYRYSNPDGTCVEVSLPVDYTAFLDADNDLET